jgi:transposase
VDTKEVMNTIIFGGVQMVKKRRQYTKEYKVEAVRLVVEECRSISEVARELGIGENLLSRWKKKSEEVKVEPFPGKGRLSPEDDELRQLRRENKRLRMERDILKKAVAIFSEEPQ